MKRSEDPIYWIAILLVIIIVMGFSFGVGCLGAWAVQSIWPSVPFWPAAALIWISMLVFSRSSGNASN
jgi:hypothetical protein